MGKVLGVDYGSRYIGLAISSEDRKYAFARERIEKATRDQAIEKIAEYCRQEEAEGLVIGLPLDQNGQIGEAAAKVKEFGRQLSEVCHLPIFYEDERFTSVMVRNLSHEAHKKEKDFRQNIDQQAAQIILQTYLDRNHGKIS
ncbi:MAG: Holliday junction resolvase RuvX [Patescibacteria group bacterium]|jgi:putative Holliday junction resolvase